MALGTWKETRSIMLKGKLRNREGRKHRDSVREWWFKLSHPLVESRAAAQAAWSLLPLHLPAGLGQIFLKQFSATQLRVLDEGLNLVQCAERVGRVKLPSLLQGRVV